MASPLDATPTNPMPIPKRRVDSASPITAEVRTELHAHRRPFHRPCARKSDAAPVIRSTHEMIERIKKASLTILGPTRFPNQEIETDVMTMRRAPPRMSEAPPITAKITRRSTPFGLELIKLNRQIAPTPFLLFQAWYKDFRTVT